jgi:hypothetical protein
MRTPRDSGAGVRVSWVSEKTSLVRSPHNCRLHHHVNCAILEEDQEME